MEHQSSEQQHKVGHAYQSNGETEPFCIGSGAEAPAYVIDGRASRPVAYVGKHSSQIVVQAIERYVCKWRARYREVEPTGQRSRFTNFVAAILSASDALTGRFVKGKLCQCGSADRRIRYWDALSEDA